MRDRYRSRKGTYIWRVVIFSIPKVKPCIAEGRVAVIDVTTAEEGAGPAGKEGGWALDEGRESKKGAGVGTVSINAETKGSGLPEKFVTLSKKGGMKVREKDVWVGIVAATAFKGAIPVDEERRKWEDVDEEEIGWL